MIKFSVSSQDALSHNADCYAYIVDKDFDVATIADQVKKVCPDFAAITKQRGFMGNPQETLMIPFSREGAIAYLIVIGIGGKEPKDVSLIERYRRAVGQLTKEARSCKAK